jgi:hypothetical protein
VPEPGVVAVVLVSGAAWPPVSAGVVPVCDGVVAVLVALCGVVLGTVDGVADVGTVVVLAGMASVGTVSVTESCGAVVTDSMVFDSASLVGWESPPQPAATPPPAPSARTAKAAARRGVEKKEVDDITLYG